MAFVVWASGGVVVACSGGDGTASATGAAASGTGASSGSAGQGGAGGGAAATCDDQGLACDGTQGCQACAREGACKPDFDACTANSECGALNNCFGMCETMAMSDQPACRTQCRSDHPSGAVAYDAIATCVICNQCKASCPDLSADCP